MPVSYINEKLLAGPTEDTRLCCFHVIIIKEAQLFVLFLFWLLCKVCHNLGTIVHSLTLFPPLKCTLKKTVLFLHNFLALYHRKRKNTLVSSISVFNAPPMPSIEEANLSFPRGKKEQREIPAKLDRIDVQKTCFLFWTDGN